MRCRMCGGKLAGQPQLILKDMPKSAQFFPNKTEIMNEQGIELRLFQCGFCGLNQLSGAPVSYYRDVIRAVGVSEELKQFRIKEFSEWAEKYSLSGKRVVEIGAGRGEFVECLNRAGMKGVGLEHYKDNIEAARACGIDMVEGFLETEDTVVEGAPYDGFIVLNYLEHIPDPGAFLRAIRNNLKENAYGLVEVPNMDMIFEKQLFTELIQDHLSYFTVETLSNLLEVAGFEILSVRSVRSDYVISVEVRKIVRKQISFAERRKIIEERYHSFLRSRKKVGGIAVWGAGHQALASIAVYKLVDYIDVVLDSAAFKQGKYTPASHIPVVSPSWLDAGDINTVVIMAGSYSEEIMEIMKKHYPSIYAVIFDEEGNIIR